MAAFLVALFGYRRRIGVLGFFILSLLLTPPVVLLILILTRPKPMALKASVRS
ncbi:hypothetical protein [Ferrovibrio sp.]|uniref:hypothetical protein n=1 Tax=Ferrovibrio sp. TaxID=1917215 RepID=UPI0025BEB4CA|nr:hypothetical protein [Ferrovibrio sp.]